MVVTLKLKRLKMSKLSAIQRQALADLDTLELGLIHDTVSRTAHLGNMVAHSVMATPRAVVGAFKGAARAAIDNHRRLSHHLKEIGRAHV